MISIAVGFYLTLFREYYRYQPPYRLQKVQIEIPKMKGVSIDEPLAEDLMSSYLFLVINTKKSDYILNFPFSPMLYFIFERQNPSRYSIYYPGYLTIDQ